MKVNIKLYQVNMRHYYASIYTGDTLDQWGPYYTRLGALLSIWLKFNKWSFEPKYFKTFTINSRPKGKEKHS